MTGETPIKAHKISWAGTRQRLLGRSMSLGPTKAKNCGTKEYLAAISAAHTI